MKQLYALVIAVLISFLLSSCSNEKTTTDNWSGYWVAWSSSDGIRLQKGGGELRKLLLLDKHRKPTGYAPFSFYTDKLAYWSYNDKALRVVDKKVGRWIPVPLPSELGVADILLLPDHCILNCTDNWGEPVACLSIDLRNERVDMVPSAIEIRGTPGVESIAYRDKNDTIRLSPSGNELHLVVQQYWDYDPYSGVIILADGRSILLGGARTGKFPVPWEHGSISDLYLNHIDGSVWYQVEYASSKTKLKCTSRIGDCYLDRIDLVAPISRPVLFLTESDANSLKDIISNMN